MSFFSDYWAHSEGILPIQVAEAEDMQKLSDLKPAAEMTTSELIVCLVDLRFFDGSRHEPARAATLKKFQEVAAEIDRRLPQEP